MQHHNGQYRYTPSDLVEFFESSFAGWMSCLSIWMTRFDPQVLPEPDLGGIYGR